MRVLAFAGVLVVAFVGALLIGKGSGGEEKASAAPQVESIEMPAGTVKAPSLADTGKIPNLESAPAPTPAADGGTAGSTSSSSGTTATPGSSGAGTTAPSTSGGSTGGSTGGGGGGGGGGSPPPPAPG